MKMNQRKIEIPTRLHVKRVSHTPGFTLIELLIAMAVGLIVLGAVVTAFTVQSKHLNKQDQIAEMQQNARMAMDVLSKEIMMAGYGASSLTRCTGTTTASSTPCLGISAANAASISFAADLNENLDITPATSNPNENITYDLYTSSGVQALGRASNGGPRSPVVENVDALTLSYLDGAGAVTTNLASIRAVRITIRTRTAQIDPDVGTYRTFTLTANVAPRNLGVPGY